MNLDNSKQSPAVVEGAVDDYINHLQLISENKAVRPGSTKVKNLSIKPIMVNEK